MDVQILFPKRQPSENDILVFEEHVGYKLPQDYAKFLRTYNGGKPDPECYAVMRTGSRSEGMIDWFFSLGSDEYNDLTEFYDISRGRMPDDCIPIAIDPGGNYLVLSLAGTRRSTIFFWDHEEEANETNSSLEQNIYFVCVGFDVLLDSLHEMEME